MAHPRMRGLDDEEYIFKLVSKPRDNASKLHIQAIETILKVYPNATILEEVPIQIRKFRTLYLDIYLPVFNVAIEVNGKQHDKQIPHFTPLRQDFLRAQHRDFEKKQWCEINGIQFLKFNWNDQSQWEKYLTEAIERS